jgi:hypothetical protein
MGSGRRRNFEGDDAPYLPERYQQLINAKKQRRIIRKIAAACCIIAVIAVIFLLFFCNFFGILPSSLPEISALPVSPAASMTPAAPMNASIPETPAIALGSGLSASSDRGLLPLSRAIDLIHLEFPAEKFLISRVNLTESAGIKRYEFEIVSQAGSGRQDRIIADLDAVTGNPYTPGQESAKFSSEQVMQIATKFFSPQKVDQVRVRYSDNPGSEPSWHFLLVKDGAPLLSGSLDPETGSILSYSRIVSPTDRPRDPVLSLSAAQKVADRAILAWNGDLTVSLGSGRYEPANATGSPVAGRYLFEYNRMVQDIPCDIDGFSLAVDSVNGDITGYERRWNDPENAFSATSESLVTKREATFAVLQNASELVPASAQRMQILSAQLLWKDLHNPGQTPRPGTIPLAWKVIFDDETLRARQPPATATGWVDAQSGAIISIDYPR